MARLLHYQTSFADGQISKKLRGFVDTESYKSSVEDLKNMVVTPQGSVTRRPGTRYVATTKTNQQVRLVSFNFGQDQAYVIEFGNLYIRFFKNSAVLGAPYEIVSPFATADLDALSFTQSADILFIAHPSYQPRQLIRSGDTSWAFDYVNTQDGPYNSINHKESATLTISGSATEVTVGNPQVDTTDDFFQLANHDLLDGMAVKISLKTGSTAGNFPEYHEDDPDTEADAGTHFAAGTVYYVVNATSTTFQLATTLGGKPVFLIDRGKEHILKKQIYPKGTAITIKVDDGTSSAYADSTAYVKGEVVTQGGKYYTAIVGHTSDSSSETPGTGGGADKWEILDINEGLGFQSYDVDTYVRFNPLQGAAISWGYFQVDAVTNALTITATVKEDLVSAGPNHEWRKYAWNSDAGWPRTMEIFQQRMCFGGNDDNPQTVWFSKTGDFFNFSPSEKIGVASGNVTATGARVVGEQVKDDNAITLTISSATVDLIDFLISGKKLTIGTSGGVFQMYGSETETTMTPFNFTIDRVTSYPTETNVYPLIIDNNVIYVQKNGRKLRDIIYTAQDVEGNQAQDLSIRAEDLLVDVIDQVTYQDVPFNIVWCKLVNGKMLAMTYNKALNMMAWSNHTLGGSHTDATYGNHAKVESITVIPTSTHHQLWMVVKRTVNSATVRYVEYMDRYFDSGEHTSDEAHYVDSGIYTEGSGVTNLSGLNHLEGETVRILADSAVQTDKTVASGAVTIASADKIHAGLGFDSFLTTLDLAEGPSGILVGNRKKIHRIVVKMLDTMGLKYGPSLTELDEMISRFPSDDLGVAVAYKTGDEVLTVGNMTYDDHNIIIGQDGPFPVSILLIGFDYESNDL